MSTGQRKPYILGVIPARYASTRLPGKALADIGGLSMIERVYHRASEARCLDGLLVATDHQQIFDHVRGFGGQAVMTRPNHPSGTDRIAEAIQGIRAPIEYVINIQGDEPFIHPGQIDELGAMLNGQVALATQARPIEDVAILQDPAAVKVVLGGQSGGPRQALYFSRQALPYVRDAQHATEWLATGQHHAHVGIYAYRADVLREITKLPPHPLEQAEGLEQLRWLAAGHPIAVGITQHHAFGVDTPEDLEKARAMALQQADTQADTVE